MVKIKSILAKVKRKWMKLRLQPIRVFCLHHVCNHFDAETMYPYDWIELDSFKNRIAELKSIGYRFISLSEACIHLNNDLFRAKKYAVLTFDDGYKTLLDILPWLEEQNIPVTLFINAKYLDGVSFRENPKERYLSYEELFSLTSPTIEIGHHGWEHNLVDNMSKKEFELSISRNSKILEKHPRFIPYWAYTCGKHTKENDELLHVNKIIPVLINGNKNYKYLGSIDRELL